MTFSINHGSKRGLNLILHIMVIKYGEKAGKILFNRSDKMEISKSDIFFAHPLLLLWIHLLMIVVLDNSQI